MNQKKIPEPSTEYSLLPIDDFPYWTLQEAANELDISSPRLSRLLRILKVPVYRIGYLILVTEVGIERIRDSLEKEEIRPGRKRNPSVDE